MALSPELFKRLSRLNRGLVGKGLTTGDRLQSPDQAAGAKDPAPDVSLESVIPGVECEAAGGRFYRIRRSAETLWPAVRPDDPEAGERTDACDLIGRYRRTFFGAAGAASPDDFHETVRPLVLADPMRVTYLDIESCGLMGEPLFLVGLLRYRPGPPVPARKRGVGLGGGGTGPRPDDTLQVDQLLARDYSEEGPLLAAVWTELARTGCLVTFNGKTFDMPTIAARSIACGLFEHPEPPAHVDLLHEARRRWKRGLPNCRLQTLEQCICGRRRAGDIPGHDIPAAYHEFVRARQDDDPRRRARSVRQLQTILHHNALDLVTMAELVVHILTTRP